MNQNRLLQVLLSPHVSEKSALAADAGNQYVFRVQALPRSLKYLRPWNQRLMLKSMPFGLLMLRVRPNALVRVWVNDLIGVRRMFVCRPVRK